MGDPPLMRGHGSIEVVGEAGIAPRFDLLLQSKAGQGVALVDPIDIMADILRNGFAIGGIVEQVHEPGRIAFQRCFEELAQNLLFGFKVSIDRAMSARREGVARRDVTRRAA